jgi:hypothetical protein
MKKLRLSRFVMIAAGFVAFSLAPVHPSALAAQPGSAGSVTARVFVCPESLSLAAVLESDDPSRSLAACTPSSGAVIAPLLRAVSGNTAQPGTLFSDGVFLWAGLPFGTYEFSSGDDPSYFADRLITDGGDEAVPDQEQVQVTIDRAVPDIERRFYFFAPPAVPAGAVSLTLFRCANADQLSPVDCVLLVDPPSDYASLLPDLWTAPLRSSYNAGRAVWHGLPFGIYSITFSGVLQPGEVAAIPELACVSPDRCPLLIGADAPSANLELYVFSIPAEAKDSDGDGFTDLHERAGWTDPDDPLSPGPDRAHSEVDTDADRLSDQDERFFRTDPVNPDTDADRIPDGEEIANGSDPNT